MITPSTIQSHIPTNSTLIVGFSGGPDSVFLLHLLADLAPKLNLKIIAAHLDHQWRPESFKDALWCKKFCDNRNIAFESQVAANLNFNSKYNGSQEELGRKLRRAFFQQLATKYQADHIVLAHHADDQIETFFIRLARGASVAGLCGIKQSDGLYLRPLLSISKQEILNYLNHHNIEFLTDPTNTNPKYLRNRIRNELIPNLENIDARFAQNIQNCMQNLQETDDFLQKTMLEILQKISQDCKIQTSSFLKIHQVMQYRILMHLLIDHKTTFTPSMSLLQEFVRFLQNHKSKSHQLCPTLQIIKQGDYFYFKSL